MIITYHGNLFLKLQAGDKIVAFNPISKDSKLKTTKFGADVALISINHEDANGISELSFGERVPFVISGPGEYETEGLFVKGFVSHSNYGGEKLFNTVYTLKMDNIELVHLGAISDEKLSDEALESIEEVDILVAPLSEETLSPQAMYKLVVSLEPKMIIPVGDESLVKQFLKEAGVKADAVEKLTIKKKDLEGLRNQITLLKS
jgi:hypothetical protein